MSIRTLAIFFAVALLAGCGSDNTNPGGNDGNDDTDNGCEPNCGTETFEATIAASVETDSPGAFEINRDTVEGCENTTSCDVTVTEADQYEVDFVNHWGFVTKLVDVDAEGTFPVTWDEPGDWSVKASGLYVDQYGDEDDIEVWEHDFDGDGNDERLIYGDAFACTVIFSGENFSGTCESGTYQEGWANGTEAYLAKYGSDGELGNERIYTLIEAYEEE